MQHDMAVWHEVYALFRTTKAVSRFAAALTFAGSVCAFAALSVPQIAMADGAEHAAFTAGPNRAERVTLRVEAGESLIAILERAGATRADALAAGRGTASALSQRDLQPGDSVTVFVVSNAGARRLVGFNVASGADRSVTVTRSADGSFRARELATAMQRRTLRVAGAIGANGLVASVREQGAPERAAESLAEAFAYDLDFEREVGPGARFELMYDRVADNRGLVAREGEPIFASMTTTSGRTLVLYRFRAPGDSQDRWYNAQGRSAQRMLMRTPINGARLTSSFGMRRHPVRGYTRMHAGVDFGAPIGTPILAAGDGVVTRAGWMGGYGNTVDIAHGDTYSTRYGHISRFASGLSVGDRVTQGQVIAYVGNTGQSTGPHLHYEIRRAGTAINPMGADVPTGNVLNAQALSRFQTERNRVDGLRREAISGVASAGGGSSAIAN
jgi:murein DD-endopeptidase MepM/ murein hydrolase activator NlpD